MNCLSRASSPSLSLVESFPSAEAGRRLQEIRAAKEIEAEKRLKEGYFRPYLENIEVALANGFILTWNKGDMKSDIWAW